jgi:uncharacterized protein (TIGR02646 family)
MSAAVWNRFRDDTAYKALRDLLLAQQRGLCGYCEQRLTSQTGVLHAMDWQIEHVLPKSGGPGRALDWTNLILCCGGGTYRHHSEASRYSAGKANVSCGQFKGDRPLPPGCDPRDFPCAPRLVSIGLDGELSAHEAGCLTAGVSATELNRVINDVLNLNCARLKFARQKVVDNLLNWELSVLSQQLQSGHLTAAQALEFRQLFVAMRLQTDGYGHLRAFWTVERQYLEPLSSEWIAQRGCP